MKSGQAVCFQTLFPLINGRANDFEGVNDFRDIESVQKHLTADQTFGFLHTALGGTHSTINT